ncbi:MAG: DUF2927 domain-containing protein, partial [Gemmobacter sp.]
GPRPAPRAAAAAPAPASARSREVAAYYARIEADLRARGLLRTDGGGPDTPFGPRQLVENFVRIALYDEYAQSGGTIVARETPSPLRRGAARVGSGLRFGASVPAGRRARDTALVTAYAARLARVTGHPVRVTDIAPNFWVYVVSEDERPTLGPEWAALFRGVAPADLAFATGMDLRTFCLVLAISEGDGAVYSGALAVIRSELPDLLRLSCFHEEIAQGLGLANDSPLARPSIFNDDEEFALLTRMDEALLRMLYDPRLRPGMREAEARPIVEVIAAGLAPGGS